MYINSHRLEMGEIGGFIGSPHSTMSTSNQQTVFRDWSVQTSGNAATNEQIVQWFGNPIYCPDTNNSTKIVPNGGFSKKQGESEKWTRLDAYNSGINLKWNDTAWINRQFNRHLIRAVTSQLELPPLLRKRIHAEFLKLDLGNRGVFAGLTAFCVATVIMHHGDYCDRNYHPNQDYEKRDPVCNWFADTQGFTESEIASEYTKFQAEFLA